MPDAISSAPGTSMRSRCSAARSAAHEQQRAEDRDRRDDDVDAERPAPRVVGREEAAEQRSERDRGAEHRAPRRERGRALAADERARHDAHRRREHQRRADAFDDRFADDERRHAGGERRDQRADAEQRGADDEHAPGAEDVAEPAADDEQRGERQAVAGDDPLQARQRGVELAQDRGDGDVQDRAVEAGDQHRDEHDGEGDPAPRDPASRLRRTASGTSFRYYTEYDSG